MAIESDLYKKQYSTSNYSAINRAIDVEVKKRDELSKLYSSQRVINKSKIFLLTASAMSIVMLTIAVIYWMYFFSPQIITPSLGLEENKKTTSSLNEISKSNAESASNSEQQIDTSFTVFQRSQIETGEYVVTGKNYIPENLVEPTEQYCYLEPKEAETSLAGESIASSVGGEIILDTQDSFLIDVALPHCQFYLNKKE